MAENAFFFVLFVSLFFYDFVFCPGEAVPCHRRAKALEGDYVGDTEVGQLIGSIDRLVGGVVDWLVGYWVSD